MNHEPDPHTGEFPAGWYGDEHGIRWWDGHEWTEHVGVPTPAKWAWWRVGRRQWMRRVGWWLLAPLFGSPSILGIALMGDNFPMRTGVQRDGDTLQAVHAVCDGERLRHVRLVSETASDRVVLWELDGDAPLPRSFALGEPIEGMREPVPLQTPLTTPMPNATLWLDVTTNLMGASSNLSFRQSEVPAEGIFFDDKVFTSTSEFERAAHSDTPCDDPDHDRVRRTLLLTVAAGIVAFAVPGCALLFLTRQRRPTPQ